MLTGTELLAAIDDVLISNGYSRISESDRRVEFPSNNRIYEDIFGVVSVFVYETWQELAEKWFDAQADLVELISDHIIESEAKSWEGYLLLITPGFAPSEIEIGNIRYDMKRVRKIVADGSDLESISDVQRVVLPLLPLGNEFDVDVIDNVLSDLPEILSRKGISKDVVTVLIKAFERNEGLMTQLHKYLGEL